MTTPTLTVGIDVGPLTGGRTGIARYTYELIGALQAAWPEGRIVPVGRSRSARLPAPPRGDALRVSGPEFPSRAAWTFALLPFWLRGAGIDLLHATSYYAPLGAGVPIVVTIHDLGALTRPNLHPRGRVLRARAILPLVARRATAVIVPSRSVRDEAIHCLGLRPDRVHVVPEAPSDAFREPVPGALVAATLARYQLEPGFLLAVGALEPRKNLGRVIEALGTLAGDLEGGAPRLVVAGPEGWRFRGTSEYVRRSRASERVRFLGFVPDDDLRALMGAARGLLYPSLYEGFGLPVVEAMAAGLPVITSASGALAELADGAALLVDPLEVDSIAEATSRLIHDERLHRDLSKLGRIRASQYTWERTAQATLAVYATAAGPLEATR